MYIAGGFRVSIGKILICLGILIIISPIDICAVNKSTETGIDQRDFPVFPVVDLAKSRECDSHHGCFKCLRLKLMSYRSGNSDCILRKHVLLNAK